MLKYLWSIKKLFEKNTRIKAEAYLESSQTSTIEVFCRNKTRLQAAPKNWVIDLWLGSNSKYTAKRVDKGFRVSCLLRLGEHDRNSRTGNEQEIRASRAFSHPGWNRRTFENDIALIKLIRPAQLSRYVNPVCLPDSNAPVGSSCYISGNFITF